MRSFLRYTLTTIAICVMAACADEPLQEQIHTLPLGDDSVSVVIHSENRPGHRYLVLHDDENTAVETALATVREHGGAVLELRHRGERNVHFALEGQSYQFDPNRIFTEAGAVRTLEQESGRPVAPRVVDLVRVLADSIVRFVVPDGNAPVVTVHNNTGDEYTVLSYQPGGDMEAEAQFVHLAPDEDVDDFIFTTDAEIYRWARDAGMNAVLQRMPPVTDDGSLSVYAALNDIPYVNFEAEHGHYESQLRMLTLWARRAVGGVE